MMVKGKESRTLIRVLNVIIVLILPEQAQLDRMKLIRVEVNAA